MRPSTVRSKELLSYSGIITFVLAALVVFAGVRLQQGQPDSSSIATGLELPSPLPDISAARSLFPAQGCKVVVFFSESCPHCRRLAGAQAKSKLRAPTVWVGRTGGDMVLADSLHADAELIVAPAVADAFRVRAVPAAFAVVDQVVREAWILEEKRLHASVPGCI